ncbi:T9SS C-terminal target domain-containing protein [candidate division KSB1 bacterium]|nr:MAG: T9SS C-terminal target domain-containing protein [candidate division KSB1 bacterium]
MADSRKPFWLTCFVLLACFVMIHGSAAAPYEIGFQGGPFTPERAQYSIPTAQYAENGKVHALVQLDDYLQKGQRQILKHAGIELLAYLPDRAYVAAIKTSLDINTLAELGVRYLGSLSPEFKVHPRVTARSFGMWSEYSQGRRLLAVEIMPDVTLDHAKLMLEQNGCEVGHRFVSAHTLIVAVEPGRIKEIIELDAVLFVDEIPPPPDMLNDVVRTRLHVNEVQTTPHNLSGQGVTAMVYDGGMIDSTHPDFGDRVTWLETAVIEAHPTHVAGTLGGSGTSSSGNYRGMAPQVRIISGEYDQCAPYCLYESPNDFEPDYTQARTVHHIELTSNSIGANIDPNGYPEEWFGDYETTSRLLDAMTLNTAGSPLTIIFAAGNERNGATYQRTTYNCMSVPSGAKNIITVGATTGTDGIATFSSWGPTDDGRMKPEVCATGVGVTSCRPGAAYGYQDMDGTSMAAPAVSGTVCLILQKWHQLFPDAPDPLPETVKALLINSATDIITTGPDYQSGFGIVNALRAIQQLNAGGIFEGSLETDELFTRSFTVPAGQTALDVSIAWSDLPAVGNVIPTLVNDLDISLEGPGGTIYLPWKLRPTAPALPATAGVDSVNVCERVHVNSPEAGLWAISVSGRLNGSDRQTFSIAASVPLVSTWASVTGTMRNSGTNVGLVGRVSAAGSSQGVNTDTSGSYFFTVPANESFTLRAASYGFAQKDTLLNLEPGTTIINFSLRAAQNGTLNGNVVDQYGRSIGGATIRFSFPGATIPSTTSGANGDFTVTVPGANYYDVEAEWQGVSGWATAYVPENGVNLVIVSIRDFRYRPDGPDNYGYYAYESVDFDSPAQYDWLEISPQAGGPGTLTPAPDTTNANQNDWVVSLATPFPIKFYGQTTNTLQVGADGWVRVGSPQAADSVYANRDIPNTRMPNGMICVFWDDLKPKLPDSGDVSYYHDQAMGRFIIEYHNVVHYAPRTNRTTAQLVFYDTAVRPTSSGDNEFQLQYQRVDMEDSTADADATIGIENFDGTDGIQLVFDGSYALNCFEIRPQTAIRFMPTGIAGTGTIRGQLTMVPVPDNIADVSIALGEVIYHPNTNGSFLLGGLVVGTYALTVSYPGYETRSLEQITVTLDDTTVADFTMYRLDPPRNLSLEYDYTVPSVRLQWDWPLWHNSPAIPERGREQNLDAFRGFRVWLAGAGLLGTAQDTFYNYTVSQSRTYRFWVQAVYDGGTADTSNNVSITIDLNVDPSNEPIPTVFYLRPNYPNPFNPTTRIEYGLPRAAKVTLEVFDVLGRSVAVLQDGIQPAGVYRATFDGANMGSGTYLVRLHAGEFTRIEKMLLVR